jgi:hypothetical protein
MKKITFLILFTLAITFNLMAIEVEMNDARKAAIHFYCEKHNHYIGSVEQGSVGILNTFTEIRNGRPVYYVFTMTPSGFVMVSADDALPPVMGYSLDEAFSAEDQPANVRYWMNQYAGAVQLAREQNLAADPDIRFQWQKYLADDFVPSPAREGWGQLGPLLTTSWDQDWPFNFYCPEDPAGPGGHALAGCMATACAQIGYYYRWPDHGRGSHCYTHPVYGEQCADFENTWYRFNEMTDAPAALNNAIAEYQYHFAVSFDMDFGPYGSIPGSLDSMHYFMKFLPWDGFWRENYSDSAWIYLLKGVLDEKKPIYYMGDPASGAGHAFVCDGYQDSAYFHFNLGWGGTSNGYYYIDNLAGFNYNQAIVLPSFPDTVNYTYPLYASGNDTILSLSGSIEDGSGPVNDYLDNTSASWLINPQNETDSVTSITINIKRFSLYNDDDRLFIYDGADSTAQLLAELGGDTLPGPITSAGNKVFLEFITGDSNNAPGFYLNFHTTQPEWCSGMTQVTEGSATFDDGSGNFYYDNSTVCMWMINPGANEPLTIGFNYFDTEESDYLKVYDAQTQQVLETISGHYEVPPDPVTSPSGKIMLAFMTDQEGRDQGWEITYPLTLIKDQENTIPLSVKPNPVKDQVVFSYELDQDCLVTIDLADITGRSAGLLLCEQQAAGLHSMSRDFSSMKSGLYFCRIHKGNAFEVVKIIKL